MQLKRNIKLFNPLKCILFSFSLILYSFTGNSNSRFGGISVCMRSDFMDSESPACVRFFKSDNDLQQTLLMLGSSTTKAGENFLYWVMHPENDNLSFEVQRFNNGKWEFISGTPSNENTKTVTYYDVPVSHSLGKNQYRLKQIDSKGRFSFSETLEVDWTGLRVNIANHPFFEDPQNNILVVVDDSEGNTLAFKTEIKYENGNLYALNKPFRAQNGEYKIIASSTNIFDGSTLTLR